MSIRYYRGVHPSQRLYLGNGSSIRWTDVGRDTGVFSTDIEFVQGELSKMMSQGVGGVQEISQDQYLELKKNASPSGFAPFREQLSRAGYQISPLANPSLQNPGSIPSRNLPDAVAVEANKLDAVIAQAPAAVNLQVNLPTIEQAVPVSRAKRGPGRPRKAA